ADADLGDQQVVAAEAQLAADGRAVHAGMEALEIGAGIDDLDLLGGHTARDEAALDRLADGHDRVHAPGRVADAPDARHRKAHAAVENEQRAPAHEPGQQRQRARAALVGVDDVDAAAADHPRQPPR